MDETQNPVAPEPMAPEMPEMAPEAPAADEPVA